MLSITLCGISNVAGGVTGADGLVRLLGGLFSVVRRSRDDLLLDIISISKNYEASQSQLKTMACEIIEENVHFVKKQNQERNQQRGQNQNYKPQGDQRPRSA
jgi:hypothetical protein